MVNKYLGMVLAIVLMSYGQVRAEAMSSDSAKKDMPTAMGEITYQYAVNDQGKVTLWKPLRSRLMINEESGKSVAEHQKLVQDALAKHNDVTLFELGSFFSKAGDAVKKGVETTVKVLSSEGFQKAAIKAGAVAVATVGTVAAVKSQINTAAGVKKDTPFFGDTPKKGPTGPAVETKN